MDAFRYKDDVTAIGDGETTNGFRVYGSVRTVYDLVYWKTLEYNSETDSQRKGQIEKDLDVLRGSLSVLSQSSDCAATLQKKKPDSSKWRIALAVMATAILTNLLLMWLGL